jgi:hypothetical protein
MTQPFDPIKTRVAGVTFDNRDGTPRQPFIRRVKKDDRLTLAREPENPFDPNAIAVRWEDPAGDVRQLGYVPRALAAVLAPLVDEGATITALAVRAQKVPQAGTWAKPVWALRMALYGDFSSLPARRVSGLEPAIERALAEDKAAPDPGWAPALGGDRSSGASSSAAP